MSPHSSRMKKPFSMNKQQKASKEEEHHHSVSLAPQGEDTRQATPAGIKRPASPDYSSPRSLKKLKKGSKEPSIRVEQPRPQDNKTTPPLPVQAEMSAENLFREKGIPLLSKEYINKFKLIKHLGAGSYGSCYLVVDPDTRKKVVMKRFRKKNLNSLIEEATQLQALQCEGMQTLVGVCLKMGILVTDYAGKTLGKYFDEEPPLEDFVRVILQVTRTLKKIIQKGYTHNDIKDNNVCVGHGPMATVIDVGVAKPVGTTQFYHIPGINEEERAERFPWIAPELIHDSHPCSEASDVFSLAFLIQEELQYREDYSKYSDIKFLKWWLKDALQPLPEIRPTLDHLIKVLEFLHHSAMKSSASKKSKLY